MSQTSQDTRTTVDALIRSLAARFDAAGLTYGHGTESSIDEAAWLVFAELGLNHHDAPAVYRVPVDSEQLERVDALAKERIERHVPVAYLTGEAWFCGHRFVVDDRVLIPRSPLAELIQDEFSPWLGPGSIERVLDLGTGSGCIAIATALALPAATVDAVDVSALALEVARENLDLHDVHNRVRLLRSDFFRMLDPAKHGPYDLILSNPPYVDDADMQALPAEYRHEPKLGLASGADGLDSTIAILHHAAEFMSRDGVLIVEVGNSEAALQQALPSVPFVWLEFAHGGEGVFLLTRKDLEQYHDDVAELAKGRHVR